MGLMDRINQAKCATGMHAGDWQWMAEGACGQSRTCTRCGNVGTRENHHVTPWAFAADPANPCLMERHCDRCLGGETKVQHALEFKYQSDLRVDKPDAYSRYQRDCLRCGRVDKSMI